MGIQRDAPQDGHPALLQPPHSPLQIFIKLRVLTFPVVVKIKNANNFNPISFKFESLNSDNFIRNEVDETMPMFIWEGETEKIQTNL